MNGNCLFLADSCWAILPPLLLVGSGYLGISQQLSYTLLAVPNSYPTAFMSISQRLSAKPWQFLALFRTAFLLNLLKVEEALEIFKNHQQLFS
jgi:hypothetical protein